VLKCVHLLQQVGGHICICNSDFEACSMFRCQYYQHEFFLVFGKSLHHEVVDAEFSEIVGRKISSMLHEKLVHLILVGVEKDHQQL
jgi:hypothetical protein